jgi:hypothetical protein
MFIKLDHNDIKTLLDMFNNDYEEADLQANELQVKKKLELILMKQTAKFERLRNNHDDGSRTESKIESR